MEVFEGDSTHKEKKNKDVFFSDKMPESWLHSDHAKQCMNIYSGSTQAFSGILKHSDSQQHVQVVPLLEKNNIFRKSVNKKTQKYIKTSTKKNNLQVKKLSNLSNEEEVVEVRNNSNEEIKSKTEARHIKGNERTENVLYFLG